jgi:hypothetical protein
MAELERAIQEERETLQTLVSAARSESELPLPRDPRIRAIARRLVEQHAELERLAAATSDPAPAKRP